MEKGVPGGGVAQVGVGHGITTRMTWKDNRVKDTIQSQYSSQQVLLLERLFYVMGLLLDTRRRSKRDPDP